MKLKIQTLLVFVALLSGLLAGCDAFARTPAAVDTRLKASGTISVRSVQIAPEIGGRLLEINAEKGASVKAGDVLFKLDDQLLKAQQAQADAAVKAAQASLDLARQKLAGAQVQLQQAQQAARQQTQANHTGAWKTAQPDKVNLPSWYFEKSEQIAALRAQQAAAQKNLDAELSNLDRELKNASNSDFIAAEKRLHEAQQAYTVSKQTLDQAKAAKVTTDLSDAAQKMFDSVQSELEAAQKAYDQMLTGDSGKRVREARARVAVARERLNITQDLLDGLLNGSEALAVTYAQSSVDQSQAAVTQAEAALAQAQAAQQLNKVQLDKTVIKAPNAGLVLSRPFNPGETVAAGAAVLEIGDLLQVTLTVYIPEAQYGKITLGQKATVSVDSFAGRTFSGKVSYISDQAEFTPRNVQTVDSRSTTVIKVEITLPNSGAELKPGMPADAVFD